MYKNNIYIDNHAEVAAMGGDIGVCLDKYDAKHGLARNELARLHDWVGDTSKKILGR